MAFHGDYNNIDWNMNLSWLEKISRMIDLFLFGRMDNDFDTMYVALDNLEMITSPKVEDKKLIEMLSWISQNKDKCFVYDDEGKVCRINHANKEIAMKNFRECFRILLKRLDDEGILTRLKQDPRQSFGKFKTS